MRTTHWLLLLGACGGSRAPVGVETQMAPRAEEVARLAIKPGSVDKSQEEWAVNHTVEGWTLTYTYASGGLSIDWRASYAKSEDSTWVPTDIFGQGLAPSGNVTRVEAPPVPWGDDGACTTVQVTGLDIGFECHGRHGRRSFAAKILGVTPHGPSAPGNLLAAPLRTLDLWRPDQISD